MCEMSSSYAVQVLAIPLQEKGADRFLHGGLERTQSQVAHIARTGEAGEKQGPMLSQRRGV